MLIANVAPSQWILSYVGASQSEGDLNVSVWKLWIAFQLVVCRRTTYNPKVGGLYLWSFYGLFSVAQILFHFVSFDHWREISSDDIRGKSELFLDQSQVATRSASELLILWIF